jgi:hypothetical protein
LDRRHKPVWIVLNHRSLILVPVFFVLMKERALRRGTLQPDQPE